MFDNKKCIILKSNTVLTKTLKSVKYELVIVINIVNNSKISKVLLNSQNSNLKFQ